MLNADGEIILLGGHAGWRTQCDCDGGVAAGVKGYTGRFNCDLPIWERWSGHLKCRLVEEGRISVQDGDF